MSLASTHYVQPFVHAFVLHPQTVYHRNAYGVWSSKFLRICDTELLSPMGTDKNDPILMALPPEHTCSELTVCLLNPFISVFSEYNSISANQEIPGIL